MRHTKLSVKQVAQIKGCSERYVRMYIEEKNIPSHQTINQVNGQPCYELYLDELPEELQLKYYAKHRKTPTRPVGIVEKPKKTSMFCEFSESEREKIAFWQTICREWLDYKAQYEGEDAMSHYVAMADIKYDRKLDELGLELSNGIIYRKLRAYRDDNLDGLVDQRGKARKGASDIPEMVWNTFLYYWLDQTRLPAAACYRLTQEHIEQFESEYPPNALASLATERTFRRHIETDVSKWMKVLGREGEKAYFDRCAPYIERMYDALAPNDWWVADNYTFDLISKNDANANHRLHLTAFMDARSGVIVGMNLTDNPCSQSTLLALRNGIERFGCPKNILFDNGREFLCRDIAGRGVRKRESVDYEHDPPTILTHLGIKARMAIVRNAKAKPIERTFKTIKDDIMKLFKSYCGGNVMERPENLKEHLKTGKVITDSKLREIFGGLVEKYYNNAPYGGSVTSDRGKTRLEAWKDNIKSIRRVNKEDLDLMLLRSDRPQIIKRNGVKLTICGVTLWYLNDTISDLQDHKVYVRYNPADLRSVRVYEDGTDKYICTVNRLNNVLPFAGRVEDVALKQSEIKAYSKDKKQRMKAQKNAVPEEMQIDALDLATRQMHGMQLDKMELVDTPVELLKYKEDQYFADEVAVGGGGDLIDIDIYRMVANARSNKQ